MVNLHLCVLLLVDVIQEVLNAGSIHDPGMFLLH